MNEERDSPFSWDVAGSYQWRIEVISLRVDF